MPPSPVFTITSTPQPRLSSCSADPSLLLRPLAHFASPVSVHTAAQEVITDLVMPKALTPVDGLSAHTGRASLQLWPSTCNPDSMFLNFLVLLCFGIWDVQSSIPALPPGHTFSPGAHSSQALLPFHAISAPFSLLMSQVFLLAQDTVGIW